MKKLLAIALMTAVLIGGCTSTSADSQEKKYEGQTLKVFNWGEYIGEDVISNFEKEFGCKVIYEMFDSNEMMYAKLQAGDPYDILVPSDYLIERLIKEDLLMEIDKSKIPNMDNLANAVLMLDYDKDNTYSVPYFWGSVGLVYNRNNVPDELIEEQGYDILKNIDYKGRVYIYDSERDAFMVALKSLGYSMNTENEEEIEEAYEWLVELNSTMNPAYVNDEVIDNMINGLKDIAIVYSGDAAVVLDENEDMGFIMPKEGTNIWSDAMVIPKNAENSELAHEFMNYILSYEASLDNTEFVGYCSPNQEVLDEMTSEDGLYSENEAYLPRIGYEKDEIFYDNEMLRRKLSDLWLKVKAN